eukprot:TRINITY_DN3544_c0_g2_i1.p1 TRINITY_DN3544_c0_g2~~TRINITY_DN3544_c0_g2_i1.p1  ORF type:complete len:519 (-),score=93.88 TRINITY_DN3544_c0_g2_i1:1-1461(-)
MKIVPKGKQTLSTDLRRHISTILAKRTALVVPPDFLLSTEDGQSTLEIWCQRFNMDQTEDLTTLYPKLIRETKIEIADMITQLAEMWREMVTEKNTTSTIAELVMCVSVCKRMEPAQLIMIATEYGASQVNLTPESAFFHITDQFWDIISQNGYRLPGPGPDDIAVPFKKPYSEEQKDFLKMTIHQIRNFDRRDLTLLISFLADFGNDFQPNENNLIDEIDMYLLGEDHTLSALNGISANRLATLSNQSKNFLAQVLFYSSLLSNPEKLQSKYFTELVSKWNNGTTAIYVIFSEMVDLVCRLWIEDRKEMQTKKRTVNEDYLPLFQLINMCNQDPMVVINSPYVSLVSKFGGKDLLEKVHKIMRVFLDDYLSEDRKVEGLEYPFRVPLSIHQEQHILQLLAELPHVQEPNDLAWWNQRACAVLDDDLNLYEDIRSKSIDLTKKLERMLANDDFSSKLSRNRNGIIAGVAVITIVAAVAGYLYWKKK